MNSINSTSNSAIYRMQEFLNTKIKETPIQQMIKSHEEKVMNDDPKKGLKINLKI